MLVDAIFHAIADAGSIPAVSTASVRRFCFQQLAAGASFSLSGERPWSERTRRDGPRFRPARGSGGESLRTPGRRTASGRRPERPRPSRAARRPGCHRPGGRTPPASARPVAPHAVVEGERVGVDEHAESGERDALRPQRTEDHVEARVAFVRDSGHGVRHSAIGTSARRSSSQTVCPASASGSALDLRSAKAASRSPGPSPPKTTSGSDPSSVSNRWCSLPQLLGSVHRV